jgi:hypothetical protein
MWFKPVESSPQEFFFWCLSKGEHIPEVVTFSTKTDLSPPDGAYLALHALSCEVAWISGAAEHILDLERRMNETDALAIMARQSTSWAR